MNTATRDDLAAGLGDTTCDLDAVARVLIEAVPGAAFIASADGAVLYANAFGRRMLAAGRLASMASLARGAAQEHEQGWEVRPVPGSTQHRLIVHRDGGDRIAAHVSAAITRWRLSRRQSDVLALVIEGHPNATIAMMLGIATRTVEVHVSALLERLQVENRSALVARVLSA